jgi:cyclopropane-fatty-acyl-phospholipid synthase
MAGGSLAAGEAFMDGWWDVPALDQFFCKLLNADLERELKNWKMIWPILRAKLQNQQSPTKSWKVGQHHYDIGNPLYQLMLDPYMCYSCGFWKAAENLDQAQIAKLERCCQKLKLKPGMRVLDIGCGWGGFARYATEKYGVEVVGINNSAQQIALAKELCHGLPIELTMMDYRKLRDAKGFDRIISIGMFEHVGYKNFRLFMQIVCRLLKPHGLFLLHTIGGNKPVVSTDPWIGTYIFPNSMLPSASQVARAYEGILVMEDWENFGPDYDKTLMAWHENFVQGWSEIANDYDQRFFRMWVYYLLSCAGSFRARKNQLWQIVLSKGDVEKYQRV